jgi:glutamate dehydrogenase
MDSRFTSDKYDEKLDYITSIEELVSDLDDVDDAFARTLLRNFDSSSIRLMGFDGVKAYIRTNWSLLSRLAFVNYSIEVSESNNQDRSSITVDISSIDHPFLVDSYHATLDSLGFEYSLVVHPLIKVERSLEGKFLRCSETPDRSGRLESFVRFEVFADGDAIHRLRQAFETSFRYLEALNSFQHSVEYRKWHFDGTMSSAMVDSGLVLVGAIVGNERLGVVALMSDIEASLIASHRRSEGPRLTAVASKVIEFRPLVAVDFEAQDDEVAVTLVLVERSDDKGVDNRVSASEIARRLDIHSDSYSYQELLDVMEVLPRVEYNFRPLEEVAQVVAGLFNIGGGSQISSLVSVLSDSHAIRIYLTMEIDRYQQDLVAGLTHEIEVIMQMKPYIRLGAIDASFARLDIDLVFPGRDLVADVVDIATAIVLVADEFTKKWPDKLEAELYRRFDRDEARSLAHRYNSVFDDAYQSDYSVEVACDDIERIESLLAGNGIWVGVTRENDRRSYASYRAGDRLRVRLLHSGERRTLSYLLPLVETFGMTVVEEIPYHLHSSQLRDRIWMYDLGVVLSEGIGTLDTPKLSAFSRTLSDVLVNNLDVDPLNQLAISLTATTGEIVMLRALSHYQRFTTVGATVDAAKEVLVRNGAATLALLAFIRARLSVALLDDAEDRLLAEIDKLSSLDDDRQFRIFLQLVKAILRCNISSRVRESDPIVVKFRSAGIDGLPFPRPLVETYVFGPFVEGIHLRASLVARGGIRFSDRLDDFRTEILGLMKAQSVKNAVIVPNGAKGGFVIRRRATGTVAPEVAYEEFIDSVLSITDNVIDGKVVHPEALTILDGDDPYLVVAADKGTATYSDLANSISERRGFWLKDAFASGGSIGYDHKAMGITARGAWISVLHHFHRIGVDPDRDMFTVVGVGDMSGDVFGNGLLRSENARLLAAFDHRHIFIDPNPDPISSFAERQRLFELPRSSWADYNPELISSGGGVFARTAKAINLSEEGGKVIGCDPGQYTPDALIRSILKAPVDLLWNGGIGTYIRAHDESDLEVGDKNNDHVRVPANEIRARVIGEGGNLGISQRGRVELGRKGVLLNTDAIDNSAGVDTSDHEVNIKIMLELMADEIVGARSEVLRSFTDEIAESVLQDNLWQNWIISLAASEFSQLRGAYIETIQRLVAEGGLDLSVEFLPEIDEVVNGYVYTRSELAVILAYEKLRFKALLSKEHIEDSDYLSNLAKSYFPVWVQERDNNRIEGHTLWPELVSNFLANSIVNMAGPSYIGRTTSELSCSEVDVTKAFFGADYIFGTLGLAKEIVNGRLSTFDDDMCVFTNLSRFHERVTRWLLRLRRAEVAEISPDFKESALTLVEAIGEILPERYSKRLEIEVNGERSGAAKLASIAPFATNIMEIADIFTSGLGESIVEVARIFYQVGEALYLPDLLDIAQLLPRRSSWERQVRISIRDDIDMIHRDIVTHLLKSNVQVEDAFFAIDSVIARYRSDIELANGTGVDVENRLAALVVATRKLRDVVGALRS